MSFLYTWSMCVSSIFRNIDIFIMLGYMATEYRPRRKMRIVLPTAGNDDPQLRVSRSRFFVLLGATNFTTLVYT